VGKATLAVHLAHEMSGRYPGGQLFMDLGGFDPSGSVVDRADALRGFVEALGVAPASMPRTLDATVTLYRGTPTLLPAQKGWEDIANTVFDWALRNARWASPPPAGKRGRAGDRDAAPGGGGYSR
jgi:hypothetical protein